MPENRRSSTRYVVNLPVEVTIDDETKSYTLTNLSLGGAFIIGVDRLEMGSTVEVSFNIPTSESPIGTSATVRWSTEDGLGVQFGALRAREVWSLNKYFEDLL